MSSFLIDRDDNFEARSGLFVARSIVESDAPQELVMNPDSFSKTVYQNQTIGEASKITNCIEQSISANNDKPNAQVTQVKADLNWNIGSIDDENKQKLLEILQEYNCIFHGLGQVKDYTYNLNLKPDAGLTTVRHRRRRYGPHMDSVIENQRKCMSSNGIIEPSTSNVLCPIVLVKKKDNNYRFCLDFRSLNRQLEDETFPLMSPNEALMQLKNSKYFSVLDMNSAYNQINLDKDSRYLTAFETSSGIWQFTRMCFGLKTATLSFQRMMCIVLSGIAPGNLLCYLDDVLLHTESVDTHLDYLEQVFSKFASSGLTLKAEKCHFFKESVEYLGFIVSRNGVKPGTKGLKSVQEYPIPSKWEEVRSFLALCTYFSRFIPDFSDIALPLSLVVEHKHYEWKLPQELSFNRLKKHLCSEPVLKHPDFSENSPPFIIQTDASGTGLAGVLLQSDAVGGEHPVCYASKKLSKTERNYSTVHREALAIIWAVRKFREYVYGKKFILRTDHKPLLFITTSKSPKCARWSLELADFQFDVEHIAGKENIPSDTLSRAPVSDEEIDLPILTLTRSQTRQSVIARAHDLGHFGARRTVELAQLVDPKITLKEVKEYIAKCSQFLQGPHSVPTAPLGITRTASRPWQIVHCDFVGPLPRTPSGYMYIFSYKDDLTRLVIAWPLRSATTTTATAVLDRLFALLGPPSTLHSDNGSVFTSEAFKQYCGKWNVKCRFMPVSRPQANPVERAHRTLKCSLVKTAETEKDWDTVLPQIVLAHNFVPNRTTSIPPYYAMFGRTSPIEQLIAPDQLSSVEREEESSLSEIWNLCYERQLSDKEKRQSDSLQSKQAGRIFCIGDKVALKVLNGPKFKKKHFQRGFVVAKIYGDFLCVTSKEQKYRDTIIVSKDLCCKIVKSFLFCE